MLQSMTGFGSSSLKIDDLEINIELKTLNSRYFDSKISLPPSLSNFELNINNILKDKLIRGKIDLKIKIVGSKNNGVTFNKTIIKKYIDELGEISDFDDSQILKSVLNLPNTIDKEEQTISDNQLNKILNALNLVISDVLNMRKNEGVNTKKDLIKNINNIKIHLKEVEKLSEVHKKTIKEDLENKAQNLKIENDYGRFEQELFYYLEKMDINEELVRLKSHINFFLEILDNSQSEKGKKLGFITQEIGREINTVGSKCNNSNIQNNVVEMKSCLEKLKEQSLNIL
ncbi:MAG: YicC/YloC family endoribonuclease [Flavobacteriales bacterium]|tara:strand:+ start:54 stop:911 length:858 start_codon:yes stop_codon:yes gene_type:complete